MAAAPPPLYTTAPAVYATSLPPRPLYPTLYQCQAPALTTQQRARTQQPEVAKTSKWWNARNAAFVEIVISAILIATLCIVSDIMKPDPYSNLFLKHGLPLVILHSVGFVPPIVYLALSLKPKEREKLMYWTCIVWVGLGIIRRMYEVTQCLIFLGFLLIGVWWASGTGTSLGLTTKLKYFFIFHPIGVVIIVSIYSVIYMMICRDMENLKKSIKKAEAEEGSGAANLENPGNRYNNGFIASPAVVTTQDIQSYPPTTAT